ncbi:MAG: hypothetical protein RR623_09975 [Bacilli bacterium]
MSDSYFELKMDGKNYPFRMTYKAKLEIEKFEKKKLLKMSNPKILNASRLFGKLYDDNTSDEERVKISEEIAPYVEEISQLEAEMTPLELGFILLKCNKETENITQEEFTKLYETTEDEMGFEKTFNQFKDTKEKVFTLVGKMNSPKAVAAPTELQKMS